MSEPDDPRNRKGGEDGGDSAARRSAPLDLETARRRLAGARGPAYWRSLEELAQDPAFAEMLHREFPRQASEWDEGLDRRRFLQLAGASLALAGLGACTRQPLESIVPYVKQPEEIIPGRPRFFASAATLAGYATGILVESHEGRPTKIEGNPDHPASLGATDLFAQASVLGLYDPDRSQVLTELGEIRTWRDFTEALAARLRPQQALGGAGIRILTGTVTSPTLADQLRRLLERFPKAGWHQHEPAGRDGARLGSRLAFGEWIETRYDLTRADVVLCLDADLLVAGPGSVRYARDFASRRRVREGQASMSRLYVVESVPTGTGTLADHRLAVPASALPAIALALASEVGVAGVPRPAAPLLPAGAARFIAAAAADLRQHAGRGLVAAGEYAPASLHALTHAINHALGNAATTAIYTDPVEARPADQMASLHALVDDMKAGRVDLLAILGGNPIFTAPADLGFRDALLKVPLRVHLGLEDDETAEYCHWHVPQAHELETWSDARAYDGTATILQPLIEPLYGGKSAHEVLSVFLDEAPLGGHDIVRAFWRTRGGAADFEAFWRQALHDGVVPGTALPARGVTPRIENVHQAAALLAATVGAATPGAAGQATIEVNLRPDPTVHDGRFANNGWLQELPKPLTKLTWDNAVLMSPATAADLGLAAQDVVELSAGGRSVRGPVWLQPGHPERSATVHLGYGRRRGGRVASGTGFDAYPLRDPASPWLVRGATLRRTGERRALACTQEHFGMEGRNLVRTGTLAEYRRDPAFARKIEEAPPRDRNLYPGFAYEGNAWGMAIDLNACTGCNACVVACQSENNIPIVGKEQVQRGREMHWLRIDRYYEGPPETAEAHHQPVMCMQCEQAPCEVVCPVGATSHSSEGLNDM
ncbi:MAG: molybdopterin oxidoreductase, partial [Acidobacteria bacterium]